MTRPQRYLSRMILFLLVVSGVSVAIAPALWEAYGNNPVLNTLILGVLVLGIVYIFRQVLMLRREVQWLEQFQAAQAARVLASHRPVEPVLLAPMANMLGDKKGRLTLSALSMRSLLDGISARLDESRELSRYLIGLLIFLGLLGTFWGLLQTVHSVGGVIAGLAMDGTGDVTMMFGNLQRGLQAPLNGMGTAFSSSLFGLAGSLVLGFLELQASQAQNRFFMDVEDWLSGATRLSGGGGFGETEGGSIPAYLQALMEQTAENLDALQHSTAQAEDSRRTSNANLMALTEKLSTLTDQMRAEQALMIKLAESLMDLKPLIGRLSEAAAVGGFGIDDGSRQHLRNLDIYMARLVEEVSTGRTQSVQEIRSDIKLIARTIAALGEDAEQR
ncbi:MAG: flagellar motor protein MotA [Azospirillum sp.]|nr:flagellar motor protein MotA [Azospirillum sp.]